MPSTKKLVAPPGYKLVKARMPDGTIKTFRKKFAAGEEAPSTPVTPVTPSAPKTPTTATKDAAPAVSPTSNAPVADNKDTVTTPSTERKLEANKVATSAKPSSNLSSPKALPAKDAVEKDAPIKAGPTSPKDGGAKTAEAPPKTTETPKDNTGADVKDREVAGQSKATGSGEPATDLETALAEQKLHHRARRMHRFKNQIASGMTRVAVSAIPALDISDSHHGNNGHGDMDDDDDDYDDYSDDDDIHQSSHDDGKVEEYDPAIHYGVDADGEHGDPDHTHNEAEHQDNTVTG